MLQIPPPDILPADATALLSLQNEIDAILLYADRVVAARDAFEGKPDALFKRIRLALAKSCGELERCAYCEDSNADEIEHICPKKFFPEKTFSVENYLFACGRCNPIKREKFSVRVAGSWVDLDIQRKAQGTITPPNGQSRFLDPILESPMDYLWLDVVGETFFFTELHDEGTVGFERAKYTIATLRLNDRGALVKSRKVAYTGFLDRMHRYIDDKNAGRPVEVLRARLSDIYMTPHQTVRLEIGRQVGSTALSHNAEIDHSELFQLALPALT